MANSFIGMLLSSATKFITSHGRYKEIQVEIPIGTPKESNSNMDSNGIDWTDANYHITPHFTVGDAITLHAWNRLATEDDGLDDDAKVKLIALCETMEKVRTHLGCAINVHCMFRSPKYNLEQNILPPTGMDVHAMNLACDFDASPNLTTDQIKAMLMPILEDFGIRMENNGIGASWIHIDLHPVGHSRFFSV